MQTHCQSYVQPTGCTNYNYDNEFIFFVNTCTAILQTPICLISLVFYSAKKSELIATMPGHNLFQVY